MKFPLRFGNKTFSDPEGAICFIHCSVGWVVIPAISKEHIAGHQSPQREDLYREKVSSSQHGEVSPNEFCPRRRSLALRRCWYAVTPQDIAKLKALISTGKHPVRKLKRAQILLAADAGARNEDIAISVGVGGSTVYRTKRGFVVGNLEAALSAEPRPGACRKLSGREELSARRSDSQELSKMTALRDFTGR
jgi:hypothetical protein